MLLTGYHIKNCNPNEIPNKNSMPQQQMATSAFVKSVNWNFQTISRSINLATQTLGLTIGCGHY